MTVKLPRGLTFDLNNIPEDFEQQISDCFRDYTDGTNPAYMFHDKLAFIDLCCEYLHGKVSKEDAVKEAMVDALEYGWTASDLKSREFMECCYENGQKSAQLYGEYVQHGSKQDNKIMQLLCRIIRTVINYDEDSSQEAGT